MIQPSPGDQLILDAVRLKNEMEATRREMAEKIEQHTREIALEREKWQQQIKAEKEKHDEEMKNVQVQLAALRSRPPQVIHHHSGGGGGGGGCFNAAHSTVVTPSGEVRLISTLRAGDTIMAVDHGTLTPRAAKVLLVDHHPNEVVAMLRVIDETGATIELTPDHLLFRESIQLLPSKQCVIAAKLQIGDRILRHGNDATQTWVTVKQIEVCVAEPVNVYTTADTVIVSGVACSCYAVSEWWGWTDMAPTKLLDWCFPGATASPRFETFRLRWDQCWDTLLYRFSSSEAAKVKGELVSTKMNSIARNVKVWCL